MLSNKKVKKLLKKTGWETIIERIAETFIEEVKGNTDSPPKIIIDMPGSDNDYRVMPARMNKYPYCGTKIIAAAGDNPAKNKPLAIGSYILNDSECQEPVLICRAEDLTAYRTAAATAVAVRVLRSDYTNINLGIIGCGKQADYHIQAIKSVKNVRKLLINDIKEDNQIALMAKHSNAYIASKQEILKQCDVVVTLTPTRDPHIYLDDLDINSNQLICAVGGDSDQKAEIHWEILPYVDCYCDSRLQVSHTKTASVAMDLGLVKIDNIKSIGAYMTGKEKVDDTKKVKLFLSTGVALEDLTLAILIYEKLGKVKL